MPKVDGVVFNPNQSELVKDLVRELPKDGHHVVYAAPHIKPNAELRMASLSPVPEPIRKESVFLRIRPGVNEATIVRPINAKAGDLLAKLKKLSRPEILEAIRIWRQQAMSDSSLRVWLRHRQP
jgi:hypothetical protein